MYKKVGTWERGDKDFEVTDLSSVEEEVLKPRTPLDKDGD